MDYSPIPKVRLVVSIPFREDLHSDRRWRMRSNDLQRQSFHPFQGRPPFGPLKYTPLAQQKTKFPSLSGKTSIRTQGLGDKRGSKQSRVSIPFREDLHSDSQSGEKRGVCDTPFPSLSGKTSIRTLAFLQEVLNLLERRVSIPFREDLHSDKKVDQFDRKVVREFPSLSGKTSIRTRSRSFRS